MYIFLLAFLCFASTPLSNSFSRALSHLACSGSISKQTHFLLTRRSVAVICCACQVEYWATLWPLSTKGGPRKLEGRRYLCIEWIISPTRHSAFSLCAPCNRHAACRCQDGSLVASAKQGLWCGITNHWKDLCTVNGLKNANCIVSFWQEGLMTEEGTCERIYQLSFLIVPFESNDIKRAGLLLCSLSLSVSTFLPL